MRRAGRVQAVRATDGHACTQSGHLAGEDAFRSSVYKRVQTTGPGRGVPMLTTPVPDPAQPSPLPPGPVPRSPVPPVPGPQPPVPNPQPPLPGPPPIPPQPAAPLPDPSAPGSPSPLPPGTAVLSGYPTDLTRES